MAGPRFSIITPSFNQLDWLRLCVASVADQEGMEVEHIVQDSGTKGIESLRSALPVSQHSTLNAQLQIVSEPDSGMYDAINRGLRRATGEICAWLNCDEQYLPGALAEVAAFFEARPEVEMLFADTILVDRHGNPLSYRRAVLPEKRHIRLAHLNTLSCATFFRRSLVERGLLFDPAWKSIGDVVWVSSLMDAGVRMGCLREPTSIFTFTGANLGASDRATEEADRWKASPDAPPGWLKWPLIVAHRARKLLSGAYRPRCVELSLYTLRSPEARETHRASLGFGWAPPETE